MAAPVILQVIVTGNSNSLTLALNQGAAAATRFQRTATTAANTASTATSRIGTIAKTALGTAVPLAAGAAGFALAAFVKHSVDAAIEYDREMTRIAALTNATTEQIAVMRDTIMSLSAETGTAPNELAHSMYFLASAGLTATQQLQVLTATAKGSAVGLGEAGDLARISANALNVFADNGLKAADVMDTLVAAVREGTAEPDEFANAIGRVLPIADHAGISFQQIAASLATMSNAGLSVNIGVTALRGLLQALVAPTVQSQKALDALGLTVDDVVDSMAQQGLIATLRMLDEVAKKQTDSQGEYNIALRNLIPNIRSLTGAFNLTEQEAAKVDRIFQQVANSTGDLDQAFSETEESSSFKIRKAFTDIARTGQNLGTAVLPVVAAAVEGLAAVVKVALEPLAKLGVAFLLFKAVPALFTLVADAAEGLAAALFVDLIPAFKALMSSSPLGVFLLGVGTLMLVLSGNAKVAAIGLGVLAVAIGSVTNALTEAQARGGAFAIAALAVSEAISSIRGLMQQTADAAQGYADSMLKNKFALDDYRKSVERAIGPQQQLNDAFGGDSFVDRLKTGFINSVSASLGMGNLATAANELAPALNGTAEGWDAFNQGADIVTQTIKDQNQQILNGTDLYPLYGNVLDSTANTNERMHGTLAQLIHDYYEQNGSLSGLSMTAVSAAVTQGKLGDAIDIVRQALKRSNDELTTSIQQGGTTGLAKAFLAAEPIIRATGMSMEDFQAQATEALNTHKWDEFKATITDDFTQAWNTFHDAAFAALNFIPGALNDLTQAAQSAQDQLDTMEPPSDTLDAAGLRDYNATLADLSSTANLTGEEILQAFKDAADQTKSFGHDLLEISRVGGQAGKDLAASLLESGNVLGAQVIADSPGKLQRQIVKMAGVGTDMANKLATKLTDSIVGPLDTIAHILNNIAKMWGVGVNLNDHGAKGQLAELHNRLHLIEGQHIIDVIVRRHESRVHPHGGGLIAHEGSPVLHAGGAVKRMHAGTDKLASDEVPAVLQRGEFVVRRHAVQKLGVPFMRRLNRMHEGGEAGAATMRPMTDSTTDGRRSLVGGGTGTDFSHVKKYGARPVKSIHGQMHIDWASKINQVLPIAAIGWWNNKLNRRLVTHAGRGVFVSGGLKGNKYAGLTSYNLQRISINNAAFGLPMTRKYRKTHALWSWVLRHEMGHALGLGHVASKRNLMNPDVNGHSLRSDQVGYVRHLWAKKHTGGPILGAGEVPAVLQSGEFVVKRSAVRKLGVPFLERLNKMHDGGVAVPQVPQVPSPMPIESPDKGGKTMSQAFRDLFRIEKQSLAVLKDIRAAVKHSGGKGPGSGSGATDTGGGGSGGTGNGKDGHHQGDDVVGVVKRYANLLTATSKQIVRMTSRAGATMREGIGIVRRVAAAGRNELFIKKAVERVRAERGDRATERFEHALRRLDRKTMDDPDRRAEAIAAARRVARNTEEVTGSVRKLGEVSGKVGRLPAELATNSKQLRRVGDSQARSTDAVSKAVRGIAAGGAGRSTLPIGSPDQGRQREQNNLLVTLRQLERQQMRLVGIELDQRAILKDIRAAVKGGGSGGGTGTGGTGTGSGSSKGGTGSGTGSGSGDGGKKKTDTADVQDAARRVVKIIRQFATAKEGVGVVRRVARPGADTAFIKKSVAQVADEMGRETAKRYARALRRVDEMTLKSEKKRDAAIAEALRVLKNGVADMTLGPDDQEWQDLIFKHIPRLPEGHTHIDPNLHNRDLEPQEWWRQRRAEHDRRPAQLRIDRKHMDEQLAYQESYRGFG